MKIFTRKGNLIPKIPFCLLFLSFLITIPQNLSAQTEKITLQGTNITLKDAFEQIEKQTELTIAYSESKVDVNRKVSVNIRNGSLAVVMNHLLKDSGFGYERTQNHIVIVERAAGPSVPSSASATTSSAAQGNRPVTQRSSVEPASQPTVYSGKVTDAVDGSPIIGSSVTIDGHSIGVVVTQADGSFTLPNVPANARTATASMMGYDPMTLPLSSGMNFALTSGSQQIEEVVVTGISKIDRRIFTGATDRFNAEDVKLDGTADLSRSLEGRSAGVMVQNVSGTFGTAPKIRVRGATSIYGSSKPLWVVDGVIIEDAVEVNADQLSSGDAVTLISSAVSGLNPDDIESFQILKDGSATSIYGARAMAGVIVVTTKRGRAGVSTLNYTGEFTTRLTPRYSEFDIMNSQDQMSVYQEMYDKGWLRFAETLNASNSGVYGRMYQLTNAYEESSGQWGLPNTAQARADYLREAEMRNTDWFKEMFKPSIMHNHAVSMSGGTEKHRYYASLSLMNDPGWSKKSSVNRYTLNLNTTYNIRPNLSLTLLGSSGFRKQEAPGTINQVRDEYFGEVSRNFDINPYSFALNSSRTMDPKTFYTRNYAPFNIHHELDNNYIELEVADSKYQGELKWSVVPGWDINVLAAYKQTTTVQEHNIHENSNMAMAYRAGIDPENASIRMRNTWLYANPDIPNSLPESVLPEGGFLDKREYKMRGYDLRITTDYNKMFRDQHIVNGLAGMEVSSTERTTYYSRGVGYQYDKGGEAFYDYLYFKQGLEQGSKYFSNKITTIRNAAFFANGTYSWKHRYTLNGTIRYEGTNRLGRSRKARWLPTWNVSGAWNVHSEPFFEKFLDVVSFLNVKASYSLTADRGPASITNSLMIINNILPWRPSANWQESALAIKELENSDLTYEKKHEFNVGLSIGFLNNRINLSSDFYTRRMSDLIGLTYTQGVGGQITKFGNVAAMKSKGVEFTLSTRNIESKDFKWNTDFTFSWTDNEITKLDSRASVMQLVSGGGYALQGYTHNALFSFRNAGLTDLGIPQVINESGVPATVDINFQDQFNRGHLVYEGPSEPSITGGFGNLLTYKNFRLNVFLTYAFGNKIRLDPYTSSMYDDLIASPSVFKNRWVKPGDEKVTSVPGIPAYRQVAVAELARAYNAYNYSHDRIARGDFIRMKEISLSYDIPQKTVDKIGLSKLQLKLQATNPFLIYRDSKLNGQDPEFFNSGGVATPMPKQFTLTLRIGF